MRLIAKNNYLVVELDEQRVEETPLSAFISTSGNITKHRNVAKIIDACIEGRFYNEIGKKVLFQSHLLEEFEINSSKFYIIPESAVYAVIGE